MNWADKSVRRAKGIAPEHPVPEEPGELRNRAIELNNRAESARVGYFMGAQWQREQLRTPEAIERAARVMFEDDNGETIDDHLNVCPRPKECPPVESYRRQARLIINALLGED